jgi:hypothetical protein
LDVQEQVGLEELLVSAGMGPGGVYAQLVAVLKPAGDLFDGGVFQVAGQGGLGAGLAWFALYNIKSDAAQEAFKELGRKNGKANPPP